MVWRMQPEVSIIFPVSQARIVENQFYEGSCMGLEILRLLATCSAGQYERI